MTTSTHGVRARALVAGPHFVSVAPPDPVNRSGKVEALTAVSSVDATRVVQRAGRISMDVFIQVVDHPVVCFHRPRPRTPSEVRPVNGATYMSSQSHHQAVDPGDFPWAAGVTRFAGIVLAISASFQILEGISGIANDEVFVAGPDYVYAFDITTWGWINLVFGLIGLATGIGLLARQGWAWLVGILIAAISMISNFAYLPHFPIWGLTVIALDVVVIWALVRMVQKG
jgi:hypothetical protein